MIELILFIFVLLIIGGVIYYFYKPQKIINENRNQKRINDAQTIVAALNDFDNKNDGFKTLNGTFSSTDTDYQEKLQVLGALPVDPENNSQYHYTIGINAAGKTYEVDVTLEGSDDKAKMVNDNGNNPNEYEFGTDLTILP